MKQGQVDHLSFYRRNEQITNVNKPFCIINISLYCKTESENANLV